MSELERLEFRLKVQFRNLSSGLESNLSVLYNSIKISAFEGKFQAQNLLERARWRKKGKRKERDRASIARRRPQIGPRRTKTSSSAIQFPFSASNPLKQ